MVQSEHKHDQIIRKLSEAGLRPTRQRVLLGGVLFGKGCRHVTAEELFREAKSAGVTVSLATVYNTLNQFTEAGLVREILLEGRASYFDTNAVPHHHFLCEKTGELSDIPENDITLQSLPSPPSGSMISGVDVIVRICPE